jgi:alpha-L-rhamnosidase
VNVSGPAGLTITMTPAELLAPDGALDVASTGASATDRIAYRYTLAGRGHETWHPRFTYSGFRYLRVDGLPAAPTANTVTVQEIHAANQPASSFGSSSQLLNEIHAITLRSIQSNMMSVLTDCPDREKGPYTGDNLHNIDALLTDYDMAAYQPQLVRNMALLKCTGPSLTDQVRLLPTPRASDADKGSPNQHGSNGSLMLSSAIARLPTPTHGQTRRAG